MSEVVDTTPENEIRSSRLKKLTSTSTWTSPFRSSGSRKNIVKEFKDSNSVTQLQVPKKFATHPTLEAEEKAKLVAAKEAAEPAGKTGETAETGEVKETGEVEESGEVEEIGEAEGDDAIEDEGETAEEIFPGDNESERPLSELEKDAADEAEPETEDAKLADTDNIEQQVKETPIEIVTQPEAKYEPVQLPNQAVLDSLQSKPKMLSHYQELNATAIGSMSRSLDDPNKVIDLGSGLRLTQQQLLDIAAKRVAPVIASINVEVEKTRQEDDILKQKDLDSKVSRHQTKLEKDFDKYALKLGKIRGKFDKEILDKLDILASEMAEATAAAETFETTTKGEIETANSEFEERETKAVEQHETDKETLIKNHDELEATKKQELEDSKTNQESTTSEIEALQEKKVGLDNKNSDLSTEIDDLTRELNERTAELDTLKEKLTAELEAVSKNSTTKEDLTAQLAVAKKEVDDKKSKHLKLAAEVGLLGTAVAAYTAKLTSLKSDKEVRASRLTQAKETYSTWELDKKALAEKVAKEHEQKRLEAIEAAATEKIRQEIEEEKQKLEEDKRRIEAERKQLEEEAILRKEEDEQKRKEEAERLAEEERARQEKEANDREIAEQKKKDEEEEILKAHEAAELAKLQELRLANDPEHQRALRIQKREEEQKLLADEQDEKNRLYNERKLKSQSEFEALNKEIEDLRLQRSARAEAEKLEAEKLAQAKLDEIEKLRDEHDAKLRLFQQRLDFEEVQKQRLEEEVVNLRKIRELREEKTRLASEVTESRGLDEIQKLIEERELEVIRLTKQIEFDDADLPEVLQYQRSARPMNAPVSKAVVDSPTPKVTEPAAPLVESSKKSAPAFAAAATGAVLGGAIAAVGAGSAAASVPKASVTKSVSAPNGASNGERLGRTKSLSNKLKQILKGKEAKSEEVKAAPVAAATAAVAVTPSQNVKAVDLTKQPEGADIDVASTSSGELVSEYEEVSDDEYAKHAGDPNYMEVSSEDADKYLKKSKA